MVENIETDLRINLKLLSFHRGEEFVEQTLVLPDLGDSGGPVLGRGQGDLPLHHGGQVVDDGSSSDYVPEPRIRFAVELVKDLECFIEAVADLPDRIALHVGQPTLVKQLREMLPNFGKQIVYETEKSFVGYFQKHILVTQMRVFRGIVSPLLLSFLEKAK